MSTLISADYNAGSGFCVDSSGRFYSVYLKYTGVVYYLCVAYSDNAGSSWTEVTTVVTAQFIRACIDSTDVLHITYIDSTNYKVMYRTFSNLTFGDAETVFDGTSNTDTANWVSVEIDSNDIPHIAWSQDYPGSGTDTIYYSNRTGGVWATRTLIYYSGTYNSKFPEIKIDSHDYIYIVWVQLSSSTGNYRMFYSKYTSSWSGGTAVCATAPGDNRFNVTMDTSDNVHLCINITATTKIYYIKYTAATTSWDASATDMGSYYLGVISVDKDDIVYLVCFATYDAYCFVYNGSWDGGTKIIDGDAVTYYYFILLSSPKYPVLKGVSTQVPASTYHGLLINQASDLYYYADGSLTLQVPVDKNYTRGAGALPASDTALASLFTPSEYSNVATDDANYATQQATDEYAVVQFKDKASLPTDEIHISWIGKSDIAPTTSTVYLQIYNRVSGLWETVDYNDTSSANTDFTLSGGKTAGLSNYYSATNWISCRVIQLAQ